MKNVSFDTDRTPLRLTSTLALLGVLALGACDPPTEPGIDGLPRDLSAAEREVLRASNDFGFRLLAGVVAEEDPDANLFLSPLSASMALGMTMNGASGETFEAMRETLGFTGLERAAIDDSYRDLIDLLRELDPRVEFSIGNSIWHRDDFRMEDEFLEDVREHFDAEVAGLDFSEDAAAETINDWVEAATEGRIPEIVEAPIDPLTVAFLINAIYFDGTWTTQFDPEATEREPFHAADGSTAPVEMMSLEDTLAYAGTEVYQVVDLPYGGEAFSMTVVLPREGVALDSLVTSLDPASWSDLLSDVEPTASVRLELPKFRLEYEKSLKDVLKALGMEVAFTPSEADFTRMHRDARRLELHISEVKQKTFVEVDEVGTEAAAVTSVDISTTSAGPATPVMRVDRPFLFALRERHSGTILFIGTVVRSPGV